MILENKIYKLSDLVVNQRFKVVDKVVQPIVYKVVSSKNGNVLVCKDRVLINSYMKDICIMCGSTEVIKVEQ